MAEERLVMDLTTSLYNYQRFISDLRDRASDPDRHSHELPVLPYPPQNPDQAETILVELRAGGQSPLMVRIRRHDLYLVGYQMQDGQWLEFPRNDGTHLIDGSEYLNFGENYMNLGGLEDNSFQVGYSVLTNAITSLITETDDDKRRSLIRVLCVMICEATRFSRLSDRFSNLILQTREESFLGWMGNLIHSWGDLSDRLLRSDAFPVGFRLPRRADGSENILSTEPLNICDADSAVSCLGLMLGSYDYSSPHRSSMYANSAVGLNVGQPMVEVFSVRINDIDGENPGNLFGDIEITDGIGSFYIYNRDSAHYEDIRPGNTASLVGPYRSISLCESFIINLDLKDQDTLSPNDEICKGYVLSDIFSLSPAQDQYDKPVSSVVNGAHGSGTVYYAMLGNAMEATIQVILINGDGEDPADVYGTIVARYSDDFYTSLEHQDEKKYYQTVLFNKASDNYVHVQPQNPIELSRSVVAAPADYYSLIIEANLFDHDHLSPDDEIAKGSAEFYPSPNESNKQEITGRNGKIEVRVTWSPTTGGSS